MEIQFVLSVAALQAALVGQAPPAVPPEGPSAPSVETQAPAPTEDADDASEAGAGPEEEPSRWRRAGRAIGRDFGSFYSIATFQRLGAALAVSGGLANTSGDEEIQDWYREDVRSAGSDDFAEGVEVLGDDWVAPAFVLLGVAGEVLADGPAGSGVSGWVRRSGRSVLVGAPSVYYLQQLTGGNRPSDGLGSEWEPFDGSHGVSGHTFLGAVPFLTVARMSRSRVVDALAVAASTLAGWGRLNDDQHYASQVLLGWYVAWEATGAIARSERGAAGGADEPARAFALRPLALPRGAGVSVTVRF
ncbi:MAG TPA: phosphatase PAP2 family protein [Thermoanaerobaculia bacterium]|nr:phosphatase PAP2 family protein [Thermoanaerobaculia bacterium]